MNRIALSCLATTALAGTVGLGFHAVAGAEDCYGLEAVRPCVTPNPAFPPTVDPTGSNFHECVYVGSTCTPVDVAYPSVTWGTGDPATTGCYMYEYTCEQYIHYITDPD